VGLADAALALFEKTAKMLVTVSIPMITCSLNFSFIIVSSLENNNTLVGVY
jgi:hypothetical protein